MAFCYCAHPHFKFVCRDYSGPYSGATPYWAAGSCPDRPRTWLHVYSCHANSSCVSHYPLCPAPRCTPFPPPSLSQDLPKLSLYSSYITLIHANYCALHTFLTLGSDPVPNSSIPCLHSSCSSPHCTLCIPWTRKDLPGSHSHCILLYGRMEKNELLSPLSACLAIIM